jgi:hypothetical protein
MAAVFVAVCGLTAGVMAWEGVGGDVVSGDGVGESIDASDFLAGTGLASSDVTGPISGQDFGGVKFAQTAVEGPVSFAGTQAWVWTEGSCRRLLLSGAVKVRLGGYSFEAKRAAVWFDRIDTRDGRDVVQVFVYFDDVGGLGDPAGGVGFQGPRLPVRGVVHVSTKVELIADLVRDGRPGQVPGKSEFVKSSSEDRGFVAEGEASLAKILRRQLGLEQEKRVSVLPRPKLRQDEWPAAVPAERVVAGGKTRTKEAGASDEGGGAATRGGGGAGGKRVASTAPETRLIPEAGIAAGGGATARGIEEARNEKGTAPTLAELTRTLPSGPPQPIFAREGLVAISPGEVKIVSGESENAVIASRGVTVQYSDVKSGRVLQITAQRAVIFTDPGSLTDMLRMRAESVRGIFLEGDVIATDGKTTVRGPSVFYDLKANRAVMLDAVFWTYDERRQLPLYLRAKTIRQESADQFSAEKATFTNTAFFDPELAIGASTVTIRRVPVEGGGGDGGGVGNGGSGLASGAGPLGGQGAGGQGVRGGVQTRTLVTARGVTGRSNGVPFFYWPSFSGDPDRQPVKDIRIDGLSGSGAAIKTTFDAYALLGLEKPGDNRADLYADWYLERGIAGGTRLGWKGVESTGNLFAYGILQDRGQDITRTGVEIDRNNENRGMILGDERRLLTEHWTLIAEGSYIGDATFIDGFFPTLGETRREFTNRVQARYLDANTIGSVEFEGSFNNFVANQYLLESQGYSVSKTPEAYYARQADDVLTEMPGLLTYSSEYRLSRMALALDEVQAKNRGFTSPTTSQRAFGVLPNESISDRLRLRGYGEDAVFRADTRHELVADLAAGPVNINPFVVGRVTAYDTSFDQFSPNEDDSLRGYAAAGVRASTQINRVYDDVSSRLFDVNRVRHIIEPNVTVWTSGTNVSAPDLPVYDDTIENITDGVITKFGVMQTFQTQRGGPGRWHSSDFFTLRTDVVLSSADTTRRSPIGRWIDYRPEYSNAGKYLVNEGTWRVTDATSLIGNGTYDFDANQFAASAIGVLVQHTPEFQTSAELRNLRAQESTLTLLSAQYQLTNKYAVSASADYDVERGDFQSTGFEIRRRFSSVILGVGVSYNNITSQSSFGFVLQPYGAGSAGGTTGITDAGGRLGGL